MGVGPHDLPGVRYTCIRGVLDFMGLKKKKRRRSIYGAEQNNLRKIHARRKYRYSLRKSTREQLVKEANDTLILNHEANKKDQKIFLKKIKIANLALIQINSKVASYKSKHKAIVPLKIVEQNKSPKFNKVTIYRNGLSNNNTNFNSTELVQLEFFVFLYFLQKHYFIYNTHRFINSFLLFFFLNYYFFHKKIAQDIVSFNNTINFINNKTIFATDKIFHTYKNIFNVSTSLCNYLINQRINLLSLKKKKIKLLTKDKKKKYFKRIKRAFVTSEQFLKQIIFLNYSYNLEIHKLYITKTVYKPVHLKLKRLARCTFTKSSPQKQFFINYKQQRFFFLKLAKLNNFFFYKNNYNKHSNRKLLTDFFLFSKNYKFSIKKKITNFIK
jgi:hypothetical protein